MPLSPSKMFFRLLLRAATVRRGRTLTALFAMAVAAALATALLDLYSDIGGKLGGDFRKFGANVLIDSPHGLTDADIQTIRKNDCAGPFAVPSAFAIARTASGKPMVVVGTDVPAMRELNPAWSVTGASAQKGAQLIGVRAADSLAKENAQTLEFNGRKVNIEGAKLRTGAEEDSRIYIPLEQFENWTGLRPTVVEAQMLGTQAQIAEKIARLQPQLPEDTTVQPVRQIVEADMRVLGKTQFILLLSTIAITLTVALCVLATLTASVLERRKDYAVMKALGSSRLSVNAIFLGETFSLAILGAVAGFVAGCGLAMWIGLANFHATVEPRLDVFPPVLIGCFVIALISAAVPLTLLQKTEPAAILKGD